MVFGEKWKWKMFMKACASKWEEVRSAAKEPGQLKKVGLLFDGTIHEHRRQTNRFRSKLEIQDKDVFIFGFIDQKLEANSFSFPHFYRKDVGFYHVPKAKKVEPFLEKRFDIVINLDMERKLPLHYLALMSNTRYRVGPFDERFDFYDLMVNTPDAQDLKAYLEEVRTLLNTINFFGAG